MTHMLTSTGRDYFLQNPAAEHPDNVPTLREMAHSLAHINRFTGHANRAYSVAEHSLLALLIAKVVFSANSAGQLAVSMHDGHECICGDVSSPVKVALGSAWRQFEGMHEQHIRFHFGLTDLYKEFTPLVKACDRIALATERRDLMVFNPDSNLPWSVIDTHGNRSYAWQGVDLNHPDRVAATPAVWAWVFEETVAQLMKDVLPVHGAGL
jgi:hypothetical protein